MGKRKLNSISQQSEGEGSSNKPPVDSTVKSEAHEPTHIIPGIIQITAQTDDSPATFNTKHHLLVVDDQVSIQRHLKMLFEMENFHVHTSSDAKAALHLLAARTYSLAIVDLRMPDVSGQELMREIKRQWPYVKLIALSGTDSYGEVLDAYEAGADFFVSKPYEDTYLRVIVHLALENREFFQEHWGEIRRDWSKDYYTGWLIQNRAIISQVDQIYITGIIRDDYNALRQERLADQENYRSNKSKKRPIDSDVRTQHFASLLATIPKKADYATLADNLAELSHEFRQQIAASLQPVLNAHIQAEIRHDTYEQKKELARWVNAEVERFGLAVKCPNTGQPAKLRAQSGNWPGIGRFGFEVYIDGKRKTPAASDTLPELELIDATPSQGPETPWQDKVGPKSSRRGRKLS